MDQQLEEWRPQIEKCLWEADCGAELGKFPSGHPVWRIPAENVHLLPETGQRVMGEGSGHGIPIKAYLYDGVYELVKAREFFWTDMVYDWAPIKEPRQSQPKRGRKREPKNS